MIVKDEQGRELEIEIGGESDDVQITTAYYLDSDEEVSHETLDFIMQTYADDMFSEWIDQTIGDFYDEGDTYDALD